MLQGDLGFLDDFFDLGDFLLDFAGHVFDDAIGFEVGFLISLPAWDLMAPFTSWNVPAAASLVLSFIVACLLGDLANSSLLRLRGGD